MIMNDDKKTEQKVNQFLQQSQAQELQERHKQQFLFEVSWEACNKVGGIYTVLRSKLKEVAQFFGDNRYVLIGPLVATNKYFVEDNTPFCAAIKDVLQAKNINCKVGYWDTEGRPTVILIDFNNRYKIDVLLYNLWVDYKVDSLASNYDYQEPILFATAAAEAIEALAASDVTKKYPVIAHFHEWLCGAGVLYLKKHCGEVSTVFTTHATVLGRSLSSNGISIYNLPKIFAPVAEARKYGVFAKHSLENAAAKAAHCFTTVSAITADEAYLILGKYPDKIVFNGLDVEEKQRAVECSSSVLSDTRHKLREVASKVTGKLLPENTLLWLTSGRYETHNKGFDMLLKSLAQLEKKLPLDAPPLVVFFLLAVNWHTEKESLLNGNWEYTAEQKSALGIATHRIVNPDRDDIIRLCNELDFKQSERKIHVVYCDAYLHGDDGVFDIPYEKILAACDFSIFPSFYEPWGYTPHESIAQSTPTVTTDLAGFGNWVLTVNEDHQDAVYVLERKNKNDNEFTDALCNCLENITKKSKGMIYNAKLRKKALAIAKLADWQFFYTEYLNSYYQALKFNEIYNNKFAEKDTIDSKAITTIYESESLSPRFRTFQYDSPLPTKLSSLRELAYNFWWSWHESAREVFSKINPALWNEVRHNPVHFLNRVTNAALQKVEANDVYMLLYQRTMTAFSNYLNYCEINREISKFRDAQFVSNDHPIAYFCMEYGIDECLPIYSGGLGILAGDYLKAMSDLCVPLIAVGLFYKQGYFLQSINGSGEQVAVYRTWNNNQIPVQPINDATGKPLLVGVEILNRTVYSKVWETTVGHVKLYLLDTDVPENAAEDREITNSLYGGSSAVRMKQEIVLGIGGVRLLLEKLNITPSLYHLNEGHSAFLLLERIHNYYHKGFSLQEALELISATSIFTTHTPVPAGNEEFSEELIRKYFSCYIGAMGSMGIRVDDLLAIANNGVAGSRAFSMTALSLRLCSRTNAVSSLHGRVARMMWQKIWPELLEDEVPITHITNGVHLGTWLGASMKSLYDTYLLPDWHNRQNEDNVWQNAISMLDAEVWSAHQTQKNQLLQLVKSLVIQQYSGRNEDKELIRSTLACLNSNVLLLGLARRFTAYKRNDLVLKDKARLARILTDEKRPIVMLIAGKAHPDDGSGNSLIHEIINTVRDPRFQGHIIFLEEYNITLAKALVQGVDVWINTPIVGREACGTSGMKVGVNGGLNFSMLDGWWEEAYNPSVGWKIESMDTVADIDKRNDLENMFMLNTLEGDIATLYYKKTNDGDFNTEWVSKMKASIALVARQYNTSRMASDYADKMYLPAAKEAEHLFANDYKGLKEIVQWKEEIADKFNTVKIKAILVEGIRDGKIVSQGMIAVRLLLFAGKLMPHELKAELILVKTNGKQFVDKPLVIPFQLTDSRESGVLNYVIEHKIDDTGFYSYGVRVFPYNENLLHPHDARLVYWG